MDYDILPDAETPNVGPINFNTDDPVTSLRYIDGEWKTSSEVVISELTNYSNFSKPMQFEEIDETPPMPEDYPVIKGLLYKKAGSDGLWWLTDTIEKNIAGDATISVSDINGNLTFDDAKGVLSLTANPTFGTVIVDNNLYVAGTTTTVNTTNLLVSDAFIKIADGNILPGTDVGFYTTFRTDPDDVLTTRYAGLYRDGTESAWYLFDHVSTPDPGPGQGFNPALTDVSNYGTLYLNTLNATSVKVSGLTASTLVLTDGSKNLTSLAVGSSTQYLRGDNTYQTLNQAAVSGLTTGSSPTFTGLNLSGLTANSLVATDGSKNLTTTTSTLVPRFQRLGIGVDNLPRSALTVSGTISGGVNTHQYGIECSMAMDITTTGYSAYFHLIGNLGSVNVPAEGTSGGIYGIYVDGDNISRTGGTPANSWGIRSISPNVISTNAVGIGTDSLVVSGSGNPWTSRTSASGCAYISGGLGIGMNPGSSSIRINDLTASTLVACDSNKQLTSLTAGTTAQYLRGDNTYQTLNQAAVAGLTTGSSPTFTGLNVSGLTAISLVATDGSKFLTSSTNSLTPQFLRLGIGVGSVSRTALVVGNSITSGVNAHAKGIECSVNMAITTGGYSAYFHHIIGSVAVTAGGTSGGIYGMFVDGDNISRTGGTPANSWGIRSISPNVVSTNAVGIGTDSLVVSSDGNPWTSRTSASGCAYISGYVGIGIVPDASVGLKVSNGNKTWAQYTTVYPNSNSGSSSWYGLYIYTNTGNLSGTASATWYGIYVAENAFQSVSRVASSYSGYFTNTLMASTNANSYALYADDLSVGAIGNKVTGGIYCHGNIRINGLSANRLVLTDANKVLISLAIGTTSQYLRGDNTYQALNQAAVGGLTTASSPTFAGLNVSGLSTSSLIATDGSKNFTSTTNNLTPTFSRLAIGNTYAAGDQAILALKGTIQNDSPYGILINSTIDMVNEGGGKIGRGIFLNALLKGSGLQDNVAQLWIQHRTESARTNPGEGFTFSYGIYVDVPAAHAGVGNVPFRQYGIYSRTPTQGTISNCAIYGDNLSIGYMAVTPPASGAIILGNVGIGRNSASFALDVSGTVRASTGVIAQSTVLDTNATSGFLYIPTCTGVPTGVPAVQTGTVAMVYDTSSNKLMVYNGAWRGVTMT